MVAEIIKHCLATGTLLLVTCLSLVLLVNSPDAVLLLSAVVCGVMLAYSASDAARDIFTEKGRARLRKQAAAARRRPRVAPASRLGGFAVAAAVVCVSILLGLAEEYFAFVAEGWFVDTFAVWLGGFVFGVASYPLQRRQETGVESFALWSVVSAALALSGVVADCLRA